MITQLPERTAVRLSTEDQRLIEAVRAHYGAISISDVVRMALKALARELRLAAKDGQ
ncbi:MAG TPA: hypothetical protein VKP30_04775 [Polyangiaceae bacterium]|nr:hypothetical protein [Polyangiaceae bacterium]